MLSKGQLVVECGVLPWNRKSKWQGTCPAIYVDYFGGVTLLDKCGDSLEWLIFRAIRAAFDPWEPDVRDPYWFNRTCPDSCFVEERSMACAIMKDAGRVRPGDGGGRLE
jgi:hypothetical protein